MVVPPFVSAKTRSVTSDSGTGILPRATKRSPCCEEAILAVVAPD